jgi:hypothetical protein
MKQWLASALYHTLIGLFFMAMVIILVAMFGPR